MSDEPLLVVEDNDKNLKLVRDVLQVNGFRTSEAVDAESDTELADDRHPDEILMDIQLPGIDGTQALAHLRAMPRTADIPVVAASPGAERLDVNVDDGYVRVRVRVERDGPPLFNDAARVFEEFHRGEREGGTGSNYPSPERLADLHSGRRELAESKELELLLPRAD